MTTAWSGADAAEGWLPPFDAEAPIWEAAAAAPPEPEQWTSPLTEWAERLTETDLLAPDEYARAGDHDELLEAEALFEDEAQAAAAGSAVAITVPPPCVHLPALPGGDRPCAGVDPSAFAGIAEVAAFAADLSGCYADRMAERRTRERHAKAVHAAARAARAKRVTGESDRDRARRIAAARAAVVPEPVETVRSDIRAKFLQWLEQDFADTIRGAANRWRNCRLNDIAGKWMSGRREQLDFISLGTAGTGLGRFAPPPPPPGGDRLEDIAPLGEGTPVQPLTKRFLRELRTRHSRHRASNYAGHGGGAFDGRGYSVDLFLPGGTDDRGFYPRPAAVELLLAVDAAATAAGVGWRALYNDYAVAATVNRHTGRRRVLFVGQPRPGRRINLNWHGPLILHFHLDIVPLPSSSVEGPGEAEDQAESEELSWDAAAEELVEADEAPAFEDAEQWSEEPESPSLDEQFLEGFYEQFESELEREASLAEPAAAVERFSGPEHRDIGDMAAGREPTILRYGPNQEALGFGEVIALAGDYFGSYDQMAELARSATGRAQLAWARWSALDLPENLEPVVPKEVKDAARERYYVLASRNLSHFSAGGTAWPTYVQWHSRALSSALEAGQNRDEGAWRRALTVEAFGDHFLSDMFSGGHVRMPRAAIRDWYERRFPDSVTRFLRYIAKFLYDRLDERQQLPPLAWWLSWVTKSKIEQRIGALGGEAVKTFSLGDIVSLALHDLDNEGLRVVSEVNPDGRPVPGGYRWTAVGDSRLGSNAAGGQTKAMAVAAVITSLRDLERVRGVGVQLSGGRPSQAERVDAVRRALGGKMQFSAKGFIPVEDRAPGANIPLPGAGGGRSLLEWRWGQLGDVAHRAIDVAVKRRMADELFKRLGDVKEPTEAAGFRIWGARHAFRLFIEHLRTEGIRALELAVGEKSR